MASEVMQQVKEALLPKPQSNNGIHPTCVVSAAGDARRSALSGEQRFFLWDLTWKTYLGKLVVFKPEYRWGWTRLDGSRNFCFRRKSKVFLFHFIFACKSSLIFAASCVVFSGASNKSNTFTTICSLSLILVLSAHLTLPTTCPIVTFNLARTNPSEFQNLFLAHRLSTVTELLAQPLNTLQSVTEETAYWKITEPLMRPDRARE